MRTIILLCFAALLFSCNSRTATQATHENEKTSMMEEKSNNVSMLIEPKEHPLGTENLKLLIRNYTDTTVEFGANYTIEQLNTDTKKWEELPLEGVAFIMIMYMLPAGESQSYDISLFPENIHYRAGQYRIKKQLFVNGESVEVTAPFILE